MGLFNKNQTRRSNTRTASLHVITKQVHNRLMRTNVNIADDARVFAMVYAEANGITLGDAITELIRKGQRNALAETESQNFTRSAAGFPVFQPIGRTLTTEMVRSAEANDLE